LELPGQAPNGQKTGEAQGNLWVADAHFKA
jgi:hypothetical protein